MVLPLTVLYEISDQTAIPAQALQDCVGMIGPLAAFSKSADPAPFMNIARFARLSHDLSSPLSDPEFQMPDPHLSIAIDVPEGTSDLDRASALLRVFEAREGRPDRSTKLLAFLYPTITALADQRQAILPSPRLVALALDEAQLAASFGNVNDEARHSAPLIQARAQIVAQARQLNQPAYLQPLIIDPEQFIHICKDAVRDGFDSIIASHDLIADTRINNK